MAYLTLFINQENKNSTINNHTSLISNNETPHHISLLSNNEDCLDTCSFYTEASDSVILAFGESSETSGSIADGSYSSDCSMAIAYTGGCESTGSVASSSSSSSSSCGFVC